MICGIPRNRGEKIPDFDNKKVNGQFEEIHVLGEKITSMVISLNIDRIHS